MADSYRGHYDHPLPLSLSATFRKGAADIAEGVAGDLNGADSTTRSARQIGPLGDPEEDVLPDSNGVRKGGDESNLFRSFVGFKDIKVVHKEPRKRGDKGYVLCFVEFADAKCARTALEALNVCVLAGYQFDVKKPGLGSITLHFAKFPFRPPGSSATI